MARTIKDGKSTWSRFVSLISSAGSLVIGCCGGACATGVCCGSPALFGLMGLSGSTLQVFDKIKPVFLVITVLSLAYAFYKAYKPKAAVNCGPSASCCVSEKQGFFQSKAFLWATTILCAVMWVYPYGAKLFAKSTVSGNQSCCPVSGPADEPTSIKMSNWGEGGAIHGTESKESAQNSEEKTPTK